jgi:uncharacterized protein (TIGR03437 family)
MNTKILFSVPALFAAAALGPAAWAANQVLLRNLDIGDSGNARAVATDSSGNIFTASIMTDPSGLPWVRVIKTGSQGTPLAKFDFPAGIGKFASTGPAAVASDAQGNLVIAGNVDSSYGAAGAAGFPLVKPLFPAATAGGAFVMKLDSQLQGVLFSTFLSASSFAAALALDPAGNIYVAGTTGGSDFPVTPGAFQTQPPHGASYAFLTEIAPNGDRLLYSTYFGGNDVSCIGGSVCMGVTASTEALAMAIGPSGAVAIAGETTASDLPVTAGVMNSGCACSNLVATGFLAEFSPGSPLELAWSTFVNLGDEVPAGAPFRNPVNAVAFDAAGDAIIGGIAAKGLPTTPGVLQSTFAEIQGGFVGKVTNSGTKLAWVTGFGDGYVAALAIDPQGQIVITGISDPAQLPAIPGAPVLGPSYVARLSSDATALRELYAGPAYSTGAGLALTSAGSFVSLGSSGALWIETTASGPSLLAMSNAASGPVSGLVAPMELISIYGIGIGPQAALENQPQSGVYGPVYGSSLGGYQVLFGGVAAPLLYAGPTQINAVVPGAVANGDYTQMQVVTPSGTIGGPTLAVRQSEPYIFRNSLTGLAAALNQDGSINSPQNPAAAGEVVTIFASGGGTYPWPDGLVVGGSEVRDAPLPVSVLAGTVGGGVSSLEIPYAGDAPGDVAGVMQVNFRLPESFPGVAGTFQFALQAGGTLGGQASVAVSQ